jgi:hypothetical protein
MFSALYISYQLQAASDSSVPAHLPYCLFVTHEYHCGRVPEEGLWWVICILLVNTDKSLRYLTTLFNRRVYIAVEYDHEGKLIRTVKAIVVTHTKVIPGYAWRDWRKLWKTLIRIAGSWPCTCSSIRTNEEPRRLNELPWNLILGSFCYNYNDRNES